MDSQLAREIADMSLEEVLKRMDGIYFGGDFARHAPLLRRLGELLGEKSLSEILSHYDPADVMTEKDLVAYALGQALAGWMAVDPLHATKGFQKLLTGTKQELVDDDNPWTRNEKNPDLVTQTRIQWKGFELVIGQKDSGSDASALFAAALQATTKANPEQGWSLLSQEGLPNLHELMSAYTQGLGKDTDWLGLQQRLSDLAVERGAKPSYSEPSVSESIAQGWARWDLDAAMAWHLENENSDGSLSWHDFIEILTNQEPGRAVAWLEKNISSGLVSDETLTIYASSLSDDKATENLERVIAMSKNEATREKIVSDFVNPRIEYGDDLLWFHPNTLYALIDVANLPTETSVRLRKTVESNAHLKVRER